METGPRFLTEGQLSQLDTSAQTTLGAVGVTADGRRFRYVNFGGTSTIGAGLLVVAAAQDTNSTGLALASSNTTAQLSAGSTTVVLTNSTTSVTQDEFAGGYLDIVGTESVQSYRIDGNTAAGSGGAITVRLTDALRNSSALVVGTDTASLTRPFYACIPSKTQSQPVGVTITQVPNTSSVSNYGWVQTSGHTVVNATTATKGYPVVQDTSGTAGYIANTGSNLYAIGVAKESASSNLAQIDLNIA